MGAIETQQRHFDNNIMYVTGPFTGASLDGETVVLTGSATVTGVESGNQ
jgi:hypothetical protein